MIVIIDIRNLILNEITSPFTRRLLYEIQPLKWMQFANARGVPLYKESKSKTT